MERRQDGEEGFVDEKAGLLPQRVQDDVHGPERRMNHGRRGGMIIAVLFFLWWSFLAFPSIVSIGRLAVDEDEEVLGFDEITPSEKLVWHPCFGDLGTFKCARLTVAMDYHRPLNASSDNPKVHVALVLVPGVHERPNSFSTSPLLLNPGGPGGSGVDIALGLGRNLQRVVGLDQDIIGFDPRGIGATTPRADCFSYPIDDEHEEEDYVKGQFHRTIWADSGRFIGLVNSSDVALQKIDLRARAIGKLCLAKDALKGEDSIFRHLSTPTVARDMLSIVDAWDEWTDSLRYDATKVPHAIMKDIIDDEEHERVKRLDTKGKLVFWGFSYGTLLGATFASMFPDRVGRVVLDGVVDADHYVGPIWEGSLRDTDAVSNSFAKYCHEAAGACAIWRPNDTVSDISARMEQTMANIKDNPISLIDPDSKVPIVITYSDLKALLFGTLYAPTATFTAVAIIMDLLHRHLDEILTTIFRPPPNLELPAFCGPPQPASVYLNEAQAAIMCSDKRYQLNDTLPNINKHFESLASVSSYADVWLSLMLACDDWPIKAIDPPMRWDDHPANKNPPINTSFPLLFIGNTADPVTPLHAALKMARKFTDAGLIEQKSEGHCSLAAVSKCTISKVTQYFREGIVPSVPDIEDGGWETCDADEWPFHPFGTAGRDAEEGWATTRHAAPLARDDQFWAMTEIQEWIYNHFRFYGQVEPLKLTELMALEREYREVISRLEGEGLDDDGEEMPRVVGTEEDGEAAAEGSSRLFPD
ncbi:TAP-like protein-domain-containing protein [Amylocarpus encephaloides]|uniref:TAP-like protein-domain-containing protein n=1 Tax=Amylocarpus encephaloides TaxID=45428 RepID=A0A9P7Y6X4_9HELO|nr:TAP-like protein-domain-containing protein [Amylocarpus encephaloides]